MFEIHDDVPVPEAPASGRPAVKYPFGDLAVKGSFFVPIGKEPAKKVLDRVRTNTSRYRKASGNTAWRFRCVVHNHPDTDVPSIGVWRIA